MLLSHTGYILVCVAVCNSVRNAYMWQSMHSQHTTAEWETDKLSLNIIYFSLPYRAVEYRLTFPYLDRAESEELPVS